MFFSFDSKKKKLLKKLDQNASTPFALRDAFEDENLAQAVANTLGLKSSKDKTTLDQLSTITSLNASGLGIESLEGLEFLNALTTANFSGNRILQLPDYTNNSSNLYKNKDRIVYMNFQDNPFLEENRLFSLDASENRRKFFNQFVDPAIRFDLGETKERIFNDTTPNPTLIRLVIEKLLPRKNEGDREKAINALLLKYIAGKKIFQGKDIYQDSYIIRDGKIEFISKAINPAYLSDQGSVIAADLFESMLSEADLYLLRSLIKKQSKMSEEEFVQELKQAGSNINDIIKFYKNSPELLSEDYIKTDKGWSQKEDYKSLKASGITTEEEARLAAIEDEGIKKDYLRYLNYNDILEQYQREHPDRQREIGKIINQAEDFISNFLTQYLALQNNMMLSDGQRKTLQTAGPSLKKFVDTFANQARSFFDQDIFGLEVEMKYIDMLAEADRKFQ